jgi:ERF superfamily
MSIYKQMFEALGELGPITKTSKGQVGRREFTYADLPTVLETVRPVLRKHGLEIVQDSAVDEGVFKVWTIIFNEGWEHVERGQVGMELTSDPQANGQIISYCRRYSILLSLNLSTEDDENKFHKQENKPITALQTAKDAFEEQDDHTKEMMRTKAMEILAALKAGEKDAAKAEFRKTMDSFEGDADAQAAFRSLFPDSKDRSALKGATNGV